MRVEFGREGCLDESYAFVEIFFEINVVSLFFVGTGGGAGLNQVEDLEAACHLLIVVRILCVELHLLKTTLHFLVFLVKEVLLSGLSQVLNQCHVSGVE